MEAGQRGVEEPAGGTGVLQVAIEQELGDDGGDAQLAGQALDGRPVVRDEVPEFGDSRQARSPGGTRVNVLDGPEPRQWRAVLRTEPEDVRIGSLTRRRSPS